MLNFINNTWPGDIIKVLIPHRYWVAYPEKIAALQKAMERKNMLVIGGERNFDKTDAGQVFAKDAFWLVDVRDPNEKYGKTYSECFPEKVLQHHEVLPSLPANPPTYSFRLINGRFELWHLDTGKEIELI